MESLFLFRSYHILISLFLFLIKGSSLIAAINPTITAKSAILINAKTGQILYEKDKDVKRPPASLTKLAFCLSVIDRIPDFHKKVSCPGYCLKKMSKTQKIAQNYEVDPFLLEPDGMSFGLYTNEILTIEDLLYGALITSGNDAINVLAHEISKGDINSLMKEVNANLKAIGCKNTVLYNPHGLHYPGHLSTAQDFATISKEALKHPKLMEIIGSIKYQRPKTNKQPSRTIWTSNRLLKKGNSLFYPKAKGLKTGYNENAGYCFTGFAEDDNRSLISVVLGCKSYRRAFEETIKLFESAFSEKPKTRKLLNSSEVVYTKTVPKAKKMLKASIENDVYITFYPSEEVKIKPELVWYKQELPIKKGDKVGHILVVSEDGKHFFQEEPLYAIEALDKSKPIFLKIVLWIFVVIAAVITLFYSFKRKVKAA